MIAKGFGLRLLIVLSILGGLVMFCLLDYLVCGWFRLMPPDSSVAQELLVYLMAGPIVTALLLLAVYCVVYPVVNLFLATITYLVNGQTVTLGRMRQRIKERIRERETKAYNEIMRERKRIEANKKLADLDYEEALKELDKEFPGIKVGNEITHYPFTEFVGKRGRPR